MVPDEQVERKRTPALTALRDAVEEAGGVTVVARAIGTPRSHLGNVLSGTRGLGKGLAAKLRNTLDIDPTTLLDILAPGDEQESLE